MYMQPSLESHVVRALPSHTLQAQHTQPSLEVFLNLYQFTHSDFFVVVHSDRVALMKAAVRQTPLGRRSPAQLCLWARWTPLGCGGVDSPAVCAAALQFVLYRCRGQLSACPMWNLVYVWCLSLQWLVLSCTLMACSSDTVTIVWICFQLWESLAQESACRHATWVKKKKRICCGRIWGALPFLSAEEFWLSDKVLVLSLWFKMP